MIIAKLGFHAFKLRTIDDAEALLHILSHAETLEESYELPYEKRYYLAAEGERIQITITQGEPYTYEEAQAAIAQARQEKKDTAAAEPSLAP